VADREPIFNVPVGVLATLVVLIGVHVALSLIAPEQYTWWVLALAFIPARYAGLAAGLPGGEPALVTSFVTHMAVHSDIVHLGFNALWLLAFGSVLCWRIGSLRFLVFSICGGIAGALLFLALNPGLAAPMIGASGAIAAMMGGVMRFLFSAIDLREGYLLRENPAAVPRMPLANALRDRRVVLASVVFIALNLLAIIGFGKFGASGTIAWEAHVGGYFFGLFAFGAFDSAMQNGSPSSFEVD
jgi:membrane associated rhomboid family serine protease